MSPSRLAFGSCNNQDLENYLWPIIESRRPSAFVWGGDAIYADQHKGLDWSEGLIPRDILECATPDRLEHLYKIQLANPGYQSLLETNLTVFGTYDDHDYGCNNADRRFPYREESGKAFVKFTNEPDHSPIAIRANRGHGVYGVKLFDFGRPEGHHLVPDWEAGLDPDLPWPYSTSLYSNRTVAVFVLDVRTHKSPWKEGSAAYQPDHDGDFLGERQWRWFETAIRRSRAAVNVVVNGLQVHADLFPDGNIAESWGKFPTAQKRLFDALLQPGVEAPILVSGDVHMTQFFRKDCVSSASVHRPSSIQNIRPLIEMTTSGMTHSWGTVSSPKRGNDQSFSLSAAYDSHVRSSLMQLMHWASPWTALVTSETLDMNAVDQRSLQRNLFENGGADGAKTGKQFSLEKNFGELEFDWDMRTVSMRTFGENGDSQPLLSARWTLEQLSGRELMPGSTLSHDDFAQELSGSLGSEWVCLNYRGTANQLRQMLGHLTAGAALMVLVPFPFLLPLYMLVLIVRKTLRTDKVVSHDDLPTKLNRI